ncbi:MAG TPA: penicillin-binding transpeptidase domain-containing protein [Gemmatimonadaceae bacterium]|nr:penicillin-binding transpeptidase domain-containing protein [Gemmatimonadaceae bacterium]
MAGGSAARIKGRLDRLGIVHGVLALFAVALVGKAGKEQLWRGDYWSRLAERQHYIADSLPAPRGEILDATGTTLAESRELVQLKVAPREVKNRRTLAAALRRAGVGAEWVKRATDVKRAWVEIPGRFLPSDVSPAVAMRGVYAAPVLERVMSTTDGTRRVVGRVAPNGSPLDGIELSLDSILRGERGTTTVLRDARGRSFESPSAQGTAPRSGNTVVLTINHALQDICERALDDAVSQMGAEGGDVVVMDPHTGDVLAMATHRADPRSTAATALSEPYEPGSTLKPFIAAKLLELERARTDEVVNTYNGTFVLDGRTINDAEPEARMTLAEVIMHSSNIGIVQFAQRLSPREEFETLRDLGLGAPTGVPYPAEAAGTLREPKRWSRTSPASMAMGYEVAVTPLQLVTAYSSIANGGELLEPALVKEVRSPDGKVLFRHQRRVVRRVMPEAIAKQVRAMLVETVAKGTAVDADLTNYEVAGKTGTARRTGGGRGYEAHHYTASFVGLFPAEDPQYVILVKLDNPSATIFGGKAAAPVSKVVLEAAIAARDAALNRTVLASQVRAKPPAPGESAASLKPLTPTPAPRESAVALASAAGATAAAVPAPAPMPARSAYVVALDAPAPRVARGGGGTTGVALGARAGGPRPVPDVRGLPLRTAARALHDAGFHVLLSGTGDGTAPAAGTMLRAGSTVRLFRARPTAD